MNDDGTSDDETSMSTNDRSLPPSSSDLDAAGPSSDREEAESSPDVNETGDEGPSTPPSRRGLSWRWVAAIVAVEAVVIIVVAVILLTGGSNGSTYGAKVIGFRPINNHQVAVLIGVTNTGDKAAKPTCTINATSRNGDDSGSASFTSVNSLAPHQSLGFRSTLTITNHGARDVGVGDMTVRCT